MYEALRKEISHMTCDDKPKAEEPKERTPEEQREISEKEAKGASSEDGDG